MWRRRGSRERGGRGNEDRLTHTTQRGTAGRIWASEPIECQIIRLDPAHPIGDEAGEGVGIEHSEERERERERGREEEWVQSEDETVNYKSDNAQNNGNIEIRRGKLNVRVRVSEWGKANKLWMLRLWSCVGISPLRWLLWRFLRKKKADHCPKKERNKKGIPSYITRTDVDSKFGGIVPLMSFDPRFLGCHIGYRLYKNERYAGNFLTITSKISDSRTPTGLSHLGNCRT